MNETPVTRKRDEINVVLTRAYQAPLAAHGATPKGVLWPNASDLATRFEILLAPAILAQGSLGRRVRLLDLGCGPGLLLDYLSANGLLECFDYMGIDMLPVMVDTARSRWPGQRFEIRDVRASPFADSAFDYCIMCGTFTVRFELAHDAMTDAVRDTLRAIWPSVAIGIGFNVMSKHVDWEREDLFHWPLDEIMAFCKRDLSRHVSFRLDYGPWETATFVRRTPIQRQSACPTAWTP